MDKHALSGDFAGTVVSPGEKNWGSGGKRMNRAIEQGPPFSSTELRDGRQVFVGMVLARRPEPF